MEIDRSVFYFPTDGHDQFLPRDAIARYAMAPCLSVRLSQVGECGSIEEMVQDRHVVATHH